MYVVVGVKANPKAYLDALMPRDQVFEEEEERTSRKKRKAAQEEAEQQVWEYV